MNLIKIEDRIFLADQRTQRNYGMGEVDEQLVAAEERREARIQRLQWYQERKKS
jgi:hypothetical protein